MTPVLLHMGSLHAIELVLFVALAVGPFLGLAGVIVVARRRDSGTDEGSEPHLPVEPVETT